MSRPAVALLAVAALASPGAAQDSTAAPEAPPPVTDVATDPFALEDALSRGADVNGRNDRGQTALMLAVEGQSPEAVGVLLRANADVNAQDQNGDVALGYYLEQVFDAVPFAQALLDKGAQADAPNLDGVTPLMYASRAGTPELVRMLIDAGADPNQGDNAGDVPIGAYIANHPDPVPIARVLLESGADPRRPNATGVTPMVYAERWGSPALVALLRAGG